MKYNLIKSLCVTLWGYVFHSSRRQLHQESELEYSWGGGEGRGAVNCSFSFIFTCIIVHFSIFCFFSSSYIPETLWNVKIG